MLLTTRVYCLILCTVLLSTSSFANTSKRTNLISTREMVESFDRKETSSEIKNFANNKDVKKILLEYGLTEEEVGKRLASLTDIEVAQLQSNLQNAQAGGLLELVLIVLLILYFARRV